MANRTSALDIEVRCINITSAGGQPPIDIRWLVQTFQMSEALLLPVTYGECYVVDAVNIIDKLSMSGFDHISFEFGNPSQTKLVTKSFRIYNITERKRVSNGAQAYKILFCSEELYLASSYSVSKSFKGKKVSDIIKDICVNTLKIDQKKLKIEDTVGDFNLIIPFMRPFEAIQFVARKALTKSDHPSFVFYETLSEGHKFDSIETLFKAGSVAEYQYKQTKIDSTIIDPFGIIVYEIKKNFDTLSNTQAGKYAGNMMTFDILRQAAETIKFDLDEFFKKTTHLETKGSKSKMAPLQDRKGNAPNKTIEAHSRFTITTLKQPDNSYIKARDTSIKPSQIEKTDMARNSFFQNFNDHRLTLTVPGNQTLKVGQVIDLKIRSAEQQGATATNEGLSGRYIITTLTHKMNDIRKFTTDLSVVKDDTMSSSQPSRSMGFGSIF